MIRHLTSLKDFSSKILFLQFLLHFTYFPIFTNISSSWRESYNHRYFPTIRYFIFLRILHLFFFIFVSLALFEFSIINISVSHIHNHNLVAYCTLVIIRTDLSNWIHMVNKPFKKYQMAKRKILLIEADESKILYRYWGAVEKQTGKSYECLPRTDLYPLE